MCLLPAFVPVKFVTFLSFHRYVNIIAETRQVRWQYRHHRQAHVDHKLYCSELPLQGFRSRVFNQIVLNVGGLLPTVHT